MHLRTASHLKALFLLSAIVLTTPAVADETPRMPIKSLHPGKALTADELAHLLDAHVWKFRVDLPTGANKVHIGLWIKEVGSDRRGWGVGCSGAVRPDLDHEILVAILPVGGTLHEAEKVRVVISGFGTMASGTNQNPFRKLGIGRPQIPEDNKDGSFNLIGAYEGRMISSPVSSAARAISIEITTSQK